MFFALSKVKSQKSKVKKTKVEDILTIRPYSLFLIPQPLALLSIGIQGATTG